MVGVTSSNSMTTPSATSTLPTALNAAGGTSSSSTQTSQQTLNQDDFLKLLVAQLSAQDPLNPVSDTEFVGQMAQFSTLQQTQAMQQSVASLRASDLLGSSVIVQSDSGQTDSGVVSSVTFNSGVPSVTVNNNSYSLSQVLSVAPAAAATKQ